jgi:GNAT superfamily N-acetyltransferase
MNEPGRSAMNECTVAPMNEEQLPLVVDLLLAQEARHRERDPRLRVVRSREQITARLIDQLARGEPALVALNQERQVRGFASPAVWELGETSMLRAFLPERAGVTRELALADPQEGDASRALGALLMALSAWWQAQGTTGELIRWPAADQWLVARLAAHGLPLDSVCAMRVFEPPIESIYLPTAPCEIRPARPSDDATLVDLFAEELIYHERCTPFVRCNAAVLAAFRRKLARLWVGAGLEAGAPLVLVAEQAGEVVGMAETTLLDISPDDEPGFTSPGRYGCIDNVSVGEPWRGQGIGKLLVQAVNDAFAALPLHLDGWLLWYNPDNSLASRFWSRQGFVPLWLTYQRLPPAVEG